MDKTIKYFLIHLYKADDLQADLLHQTSLVIHKTENGPGVARLVWQDSGCAISTLKNTVDCIASAFALLSPVVLSGNDQPADTIADRMAIRILELQRHGQLGCAAEAVGQYFRHRADYRVPQRNQRRMVNNLSLAYRGAVMISGFADQTALS